MTSNVFFMKTNIWNNAFTQTLAYENNRYVIKCIEYFKNILNCSIAYASCRNFSMNIRYN